jgi:hypothetical protein
MCQPCHASPLRAVLCREQAQRLQQLRPELEKLRVRMVAVVHEWNEPEVCCLLCTREPANAYYWLAKGSPVRGCQKGLPKGRSAARLHMSGLTGVVHFATLHHLLACAAACVHLIARFAGL